ncbi:hypothetical protein K490DRAFT_66685 [Saccharata proteae CBS 121410]|uniref:Uncharacterized protein n=1 Tax=Saccharata proteae CBS 121410 TaxID=1314787 RepID=A0A9P4HTK3_9PEZI|nr:hypothetical protein K490DRAFT_66685 [Saccharata proteae CBS 121410]
MEIDNSNLLGEPPCSTSDTTLVDPQSQTSGFLSHFIRHLAVHCSFLIFTGASLWLIGFVGLEVPVRLADYSTYCLSDGEFVFRYDLDYNYLWRGFSMVAISIPFGSMNFEVAKFIDIAWDIGIGRLGQVLLGLITCRVFLKYLLMKMETVAIPHDVTSSVAFTGTCSWETLFRLSLVRSKAQLWKHSLNPIMVMTFLVAYLISFPTLLSAMTGYTTTFNPFMMLPNGTMVPFGYESFLSIDYIIEDGDRIGLPNQSHLWVNYTYPLTTYGIVETGWSNNTVDGPDFLTDVLVSRDHNSTLLWPNGTISILDSPLNITEPYDQWYVYGLDVPLTSSDFSINGTCQAQKAYQWGFSFQLLSIFSVLNLLWGLATYGLWLASTRASDARANYGSYKAALDLVSAMRPDGSDLSCLHKLSDSELRQLLVKSRAGIVLEKGEDGVTRPLLWDWTVLYKKQLPLRIRLKMFLVRRAEFTIDLAEMSWANACSLATNACSLAAQGLRLVQHPWPTQRSNLRRESHELLAGT